VREGFTQMMAIAGQALPPTVFSPTGICRRTPATPTADIKRAFWKTVQNLGVIWGLFSVVVIVAGTTALHNIYTVPARVSSASATSRRSKASRRRQVLGPRFRVRSDSWRRGFFSLGLVGAGIHHAHLRVVDDDLSLSRHVRTGLALHASNKKFQIGLRVVDRDSGAADAVLGAPALLKAIIAMVGNLLLAPAAVAVIFYFVNRPAMGELRANAGATCCWQSRCVFSVVSR
jgi:hypothetical protein